MTKQTATILLAADRSFTTIQQIEVDEGVTGEQLQALAHVLFDKVSPAECEIETDFEWGKVGATAWIDEDSDEGTEDPQYQATLIDGEWTITPIKK